MKARELITVQLMGSFLIKTDSLILTEEKIHSNKIVKLIVFLLLNRDRMVSPIELMDELFQKKANNRLSGPKNLVYRARTILAENGFEDLIITVPGGYQWNPAYTVKTDYETYEELVKQAAIETNIQIRQKLCEEVVQYFRGNITSKLIEEEWLIVRAEKYRDMYLDTVRLLGAIYETKCMWKELEELCEQAFVQDSLDEEFHYWMICSLSGQKKHNAAMQHYQETSQLLYRTLGIRNTEKLRQAFEDIFQQRADETRTVASLWNELQEQGGEGAFLCDYQAFRQIYRIEARRIKRNGMTEWFVLLTMRYQNQEVFHEVPSKDPLLLSCMDKVEELLRTGLRSSDVATRLNAQQFGLLLPSCTEEEVNIVMNRLCRKFTEDISENIWRLDYELEELKA